MLYAIKSGIIGQILSLIIYVMTNLNFSLQLSKRHFIGLSEHLNFPIISGVISQERALHCHTSVKCNISKVHFT